MAIIEYFGGHQSRNLGDIAVYSATKKLLEDHLLIEDGLWEAHDCGLIGGGTLFPRILGNSVFPFREHNSNFSLGTGVMDPKYYNRRTGPFDARYYAGEAGISLREFLIGRSYIGEGLIRSIERRVPNLDLSSHYLRDVDFERIKSIDFDFLGVRGPISKKILSSHNIGSVVVGDPALYLQSEVSNTVERRIVIALQTTDADGWGDPSYFHNKIHKFSNIMCDTHNLIFAPVNPKDIPPNLRIANEIPSARFVDMCSLPDLQSYLDLLATAELVIGERLHANILSAAVGTPFISAEYKPKHTDFAMSINCENWNIRRDEISTELMIDMYESISNNTEGIKRMNSEVGSRRSDLEDACDTITSSI